MRSTTYREVVALALSEEMERDDRVWMMGEDVAAAGGVFKATRGLLERFGQNRVRDTPISEQAIVGCAIGSAVTGLRPVAEIMFADFAGVCFDGIANQLAKYRYMTGGQVSVPVTLRLANGAGLGFGAQHSQAVENWFLSIAGLKICVPGSPADLYGLLKSAIRDDDPVLVFEHKALYGMKGDISDEETLVPIGKGAIVRTGTDVTVVATQLTLQHTIRAADTLAGEGIDVEVLDLRSLAPLDLDLILESVGKTSRLAIVQEAPLPGSWGATVTSAIMQDGSDSLDAPPCVVSSPMSPIPYAGDLEEAWIPNEARIAAAVRELCGR